ncbi:MAG: hypothetical protein Kow0063_42160 [Anaerolineae bacterium]
MSREHIFFASALILFLALTAWQLNLPGLHYDEAYEALPAMQLLLDQPVTSFRNNGIWVGGRLLPLMTQDYIGALNTYTAIAFLGLLGISPVSLRIMAISIGLLTLWLTFRLADELFGPLPAVVAVMLLSVNPTFVFWSRQGVFVTSVTAAIGLAAVLMWLSWWRTGDRRYGLGGGFLLGLGLYAKFLFLWLIMALGLAVLALNLGQWRRIKNRLTPGLVIWSLVAFLLGSAPLILYNLQTGGTLDSIGSNLTVSYYGTNNLAFFANLLERIKQLVTVLNGGHLWYLGATYANWLNPVLFVLALGVTLAFLITNPQHETRRALFPFLVIGGVILFSCATVSALWVTHFAILMPWPALAVAAATGLLVRNSQVGRRGAVNLALLLAFLVPGISWLAEIATDVCYHRALTLSGGLGAHSDAVDDLARWLVDEGRSGRPVVAMDWGIAAPVTFLTRGEVTPVEAFGYEWETDAEFVARLEPFIRDSASIYLWRAPDEIIFDRSADFRRIYEARGLEEDILEAFYERSGRPVLGATGLVPEGEAVNPPRPPKQLRAPQ